jgi:type IV secretion system protein VirB9
MRNKILVQILGFSLFLFSTAGFGEAIPKKGKLDKRIRTTEYNESQVFHVNAGIGQMTHLRFSKGETFEQWYSGDPKAIVFKAHKNYVHFKPIAKKINTNLIIHTNKRAYNIALHLDRSAYWGVHFSYPEDEKRMAQQKKIVKEAQSLLDPAKQHRKNNQYIGAGSYAIRPVDVFDNGTHTFFHFPEQVDIPSLFRVRENGQELITQAVTFGNWRIVPRTQKRWALRLGEEVLVIRNLGFSLDAPENKSHTVSPDLIRSALNNLKEESNNG